VLHAVKPAQGPEQRGEDRGTRAPTCSRTIEGSGFVISKDHVITERYVVAGIDKPEVYTRFALRRAPGARRAL
jgi:hypothetical protein